MSDKPMKGELLQPLSCAAAPPDRSAGVLRGPFLAVVIILALAAVGLNGSVGLLRLHFKKEPVPMQQKFSQAIPPIIDDWVEIAREESLPADMLQALDTNEFLFTNFVNAGKLNRTPEGLRREAAGMTLPRQKELLSELARKNPPAVLRVSLTYYTGKADTVAHIPERCYVGDGFDTVNSRNETWPLGRGLGGVESTPLPQELRVRFITFEGERDNIPRHVAYFFHVNGRYEADSLAVRAQLQNLFARYGYYAKVELMCIADNRSVADVKQSMQDFLRSALPRIEAALPLWSRYEGARSAGQE